MYDAFLAAIMGLVEGLTEFLPVSSTGHLILAGQWLGFEDAVGAEVAKTFEVFIQLGAILAVVAAFPQRFVGLCDFRGKTPLIRRPPRSNWQRFIRLFDFRSTNGFAGMRGIGLLLLTSVPALILGAVLHGIIKERLFNPTTVAIGLALGAVWILVMEWRRQRVRCDDIDSLSWREALAIGLFQCIALWPGMSRAASTILGGMMIGVDRKTATAYSFFAAVPVLCAAGIYDIYKSRAYLNAEHLPLFAVGFVASFLFAYLAVKWLLRFVGSHTLTPFAWYRLALAGVVLWSVWGKG